MQKIMCFALTLIMALQMARPAYGASSVASQITAMPPGTRIELRLKDKQKMSGTTGALSETSFAFIDTAAGEHQIAFDDVASVKRVGGKSHTTRNVLIIAGIGVAVTAIVIIVHAKECPLGCNARAGI